MDTYVKSLFIAIPSFIILIIIEMIVSKIKGVKVNGHADMTMGFKFGYSLKVVEVTESKVVSKILELNHPWVKIREGDKVIP